VKRLLGGALMVCLGLVAIYALALVQCSCGLIGPLAAVETVMPYWALQYFLLVPLALMVLEVPFTGWRNSSLAMILGWSPSIRTDALYLAIQSTAVLPALMAATTGGLFWHLRQLVDAHTLKLGLVIANPILQCAVIFVVGDFVSYWVHRWMHVSPALWEAHKVHHSATDLNLMIAFRFHPLEKTVLELGYMFSFLVLGATTDTFVTFSFINMLLGQIQHARVDWTYGPVGKVLVSPMFHRFHHSIHRADFDKNFASRLVIWDMLFGTYSAKRITPQSIGVDDNTYERGSLAAEFFRPYYVWCLSAVDTCRRAVATAGALARRRPAKEIVAGPSD